MIFSVMALFSFVHLAVIDSVHGGGACEGLAGLPPLLKSGDGRTVTTAAEWETVRRPEILRTFEREVYGVRPVERPADLSFETVVDEPEALGGVARQKRARITWKGPYDSQSLLATAFLPRTATPEKPAPAFVFIAGRGGTIYSHRLASEGSVGSFDRNERWPAEEMVKRGFAMVAYDCTDVAEDDYSAFKADVFRCFTKPEDRTDTSWATISAWAWGASRVLDWIETEKSIDASASSGSPAAARPRSGRARPTPVSRWRAARGAAAAGRISSAARIRAWSRSAASCASATGSAARSTSTRDAMRRCRSTSTRCSRSSRRGSSASRPAPRTSARVRTASIWRR